MRSNFSAIVRAATFGIFTLCLLAGIGATPTSLSAADGWSLVPVPGGWSTITEPPLAEYDGIAWYRTFVIVPAEWADAALTLKLGRIDDADVTFVNGRRVGATGAFPPEAKTAWNAERSYRIPPSAILAGRPNMIAIRVHDSGGNGGMVGGSLALVGPTGQISLSGGTWQFRPAMIAPSQSGRPRRNPTRRSCSRGSISGPKGAARSRPGTGSSSRGRTNHRPVRGHSCIDSPPRRGPKRFRSGTVGWGAMVFGDPRTVHLQLNEESIWAGLPATATVRRRTRRTARRARSSSREASRGAGSSPEGLHDRTPGAQLPDARGPAVFEPRGPVGDRIPTFPRSPDRHRARRVRLEGGEVRAGGFRERGRRLSWSFGSRRASRGGSADH